MLLFGHFVKPSKDGFAKPNRDRGGWFADNAFARIANIFFCENLFGVGDLACFLNLFSFG
jgi:hypothetical protein